MWACQDIALPEIGNNLNVAQIMLMVQPISYVLGKIKFLGIAFADFKKSLNN